MQFHFKFKSYTNVQLNDNLDSFGYCSKLWFSITFSTKQYQQMTKFLKPTGKVR